ncbi:MAG: hypothetical protein CMB59_06045 [Euryarchaeota archaeon]|nr:hypothetical protein [Euryarchaeota archaeon]|tara:strand:- start:274 stop:1302 length:1029 start_codon:yes stop_codon:yes gene_type:complete
MSYFRPVEILVILLVIISTASLDFKTEESELGYLEVEYIEGTLDLKTRSSMDSLGLNDFKPGALVELNLNVDSITSECQICKNKPLGVLLSGEVNVSGLRPIDSGGQIRIEGNLNVTHLQEFSSKDMIIREWLTIDWDLDEFSAQWDIFIEHNPPKWSLDNRYDASLVDSGDAKKSRVGPVIYLEEIIENSINIHGCMPNSMNCDGVNREEMNLTTKLTTEREPTNVVFSSNWINYDVASVNISDTQNIGDIRNLFEIEDSTTNHSAFCLEDVGDIVSVQSWKISGETSSSISPMGLWLSSIGLPSSSFTPTGGIWTEIDSEDSGCGAFSKNGKLYLGISKS